MQCYQLNSTETSSRTKSLEDFLSLDIPTIPMLSKIFPSPAGFNRLDAKMSSWVRNWKSEQHLNLTQYTL